MDHKITLQFNRRHALLALCAGVAGASVVGYGSNGLIGSLAQAQGSPGGTSGAAMWPEGTFARLELLEGGGTGTINGHMRAGIVIAMRPGFKTYWRMPGDTGVPPQFNFAGSDNLKEAHVLYPAPRRFADGAGGTSIGYSAPVVIFPLHIEAIDPARPVTLRMKADYAVCERMCIPVSGEATLLLQPGATKTGEKAGHTRIKAAEAQVPMAAKLRDNSALSIANIRRGDAPESILIDVILPDSEPADLFVEAPSPWFFETKPITKNAGHSRFEIVAIERSKALDCTGVDLVLTLTSGSRAIEVKTWLDVALLAP